MTTPEASERLKMVRSRGTSLEARMEDILRGMGIAYEVQPALPGRPDFRIEGTRVLVFCDSSFWHGRRETDRNGSSFARNRALWAKKLEANRRRDATTSRKLRRAGWSVHRFWDTDIVPKPDKVADRLRRVVDAS